MGLFSSIGSAISSACSSICSACSSFASSIGGALGGAVGAFSTALGVALGVNPATIALIIAIVVAVGMMCGVNEDGMEPEELGERAMHPDAKKPEDFDSIEEYIEHLKNDIEIDKEALEKKTPEEKAALAMVGATIIVKGIEEKTGMELSPEFLVAVGKCDMKSEEVKAYMDSFKEKGITDMKVMSDYLNGKCAPEQVGKAGGAIESAIEKLNPDISTKDMDGKIDKMMEDLKATV